MSPPTQSSSKFTRRTHRKSRTGCLTCKIRRKKCDEARPSCGNCVSSGRTCDGYPEISIQQWGLRKQNDSEKELHRPVPQRTDVVRSQSTGAQRILPSVNQTIALINPPAAFSINERDTQYFDFFYYKTLTCFTNYYDSSFWDLFLLHHFATNTTVRRALLAVGAAHRAYALPNEAGVADCQDYAARSYVGAMRLFRDSLSNNEGSAIYVVVSKLFAIFETFRDDTDVATNHVRMGLKVLCETQTRQMICNRVTETPPATIENVSSLSASLEHFLHGLFEHTPDVINYQESSSFQTLDDAYNTLRALTHEMSRNLNVYNCIPDFQGCFRIIFKWNVAFHEWCHGRFLWSKSEKRQIRALKLYREVSYLLILVIVARKDSLQWWSDGISDADQVKLDAQFSKLCGIIQRFIQDPDQYTHLSSGKILGFSRKLGLVGHDLPLLDTSDPILQSAHQIGHKLARVEGIAAKACLLPSHQPTWVDVASSIETGRIMLRYTALNPAGQFVWTQRAVAVSTAGF